MKYDVWSCGIMLFYMVTAESIWDEHKKDVCAPLPRLITTDAHSVLRFRQCFKFFQKGGPNLLSNTNAGLWDAVSKLQKIEDPIDPAFQVRCSLGMFSVHGSFV